jgi:hypothetical protein
VSGGLNVSEYSFNFAFANQITNGYPAFSAHIIDELGNSVSATILVPTNSPDFTIITSNSSPIGGTNSGGGLADNGSTVSVTATPNPGFSFSSWSANGFVVSLLSNYTFTATSNCTLVANFTTNFYTITTSNLPPDAGITTGDTNTIYGASLTVMANANLGYFFANWTTPDGTLIWDQTSNYTFTLESNVVLVANYVPAGSSMIRTVVSPPSAGSTTGDGIYTNGVAATISATAAHCYSFVGWTTNGGVFSTSSTNTVAVTTNEVFTANFTPISYNIATSASAGGQPAAAGLTIVETR